jgi:hypothetical protein
MVRQISLTYELPDIELQKTEAGDSEVSENTCFSRTGYKPSLRVSGVEGKLPRGRSIFMLHKGKADISRIYSRKQQKTETEYLRHISLVCYI